MDRALDPDLVTRLRDALERLAPQGRIGLAVSGGPDSMALLVLCAQAIPGRFEVATVDHGLRAAAAAECALVEATCTARGIACTTLAVTLAPGNLQQAARRARYAALGAWCDSKGLVAMATAHHADDQAETLLMRLNRGSGVSGLAGIRPASRVPGCAVPVIRPLLDCRRHELAAAVAAAGVRTVADPSNGDERFDRVRVRQALAATDWLDPAMLARSASLIGGAEDTLAAMADQAWAEGAVEVGASVSVPVSPWREINLRLLERALATFDRQASRSDLAALLDMLGSEGAKANLTGVLVTRRGERFECAPEPPRKAQRSRA